MSEFSEIKVSEWNEAVQLLDKGSVFMNNSWEQAVSESLPFVEYRHYRYGDSHLIRVASINGRYTTAPFSEGGDVVSLGKTPINLSKFQNEIQTQFGEVVRLRVNERFSPVSDAEESSAVAEESVVPLGEPLLPRVRKTLRHILKEPIVGQIKRTEEDSDIDVAYYLYLRHMRNVRNFAIPKRLFVSLIREYGGELWIWSDNKVPDAMAVFIPSDTEVLYSMSAANQKAFSAHAPHHILYSALETYREEGKTKVSLGATGKGSALEVFKRGWRGEQYSIYELGERSGVSRTSRVRDMVRFVPLSLYPLLTRFLGQRFL